MAPSLTLDSYRQIGRNAAGYALGRPVAPVPTVLDNYARAKLIVRTTLLHAREAAEVVRGAGPVELVLADHLAPVCRLSLTPVRHESDEPDPAPSDAERRVVFRFARSAPAAEHRTVRLGFAAVASTHS